MYSVLWGGCVEDKLGWHSHHGVTSERSVVAEGTAALLHAHATTNQRTSGTRRREVAAKPWGGNACHPDSRASHLEKKVKRSVIESLLFNHWVRNQIEASLRIPDSGNPNLQIEAVQVWLGKASRLVQRREHHAKRVVEQRVGRIVGWRRNHAAG